jgi:hypothetical protein
MTMTLKELEAREPLAAAVARQLGGWRSFKESASDIANHGIDGGFSGFIYYTDTVKFARRNLSAIRDALRQDADDFGNESAAELVKGFRCLNGDYSIDEINEVLYRGKSTNEDAETAVLNALAWYAAERVARAYADSD